MALFATQLDAQLSQGDVFGPDWDNDRAPSMGSVIVVSEGCDIENSPDTVLVAKTLPDGETEPGLLANIRGGRVWRALHIEELGMWVNLRTIQPAPKEHFEGRLDRRLASMTPEGRNALAGKVFAFLTHRLPPRLRYFRDDSGVVWDAWEVRPIDIARLEDQFRRRVSPELLGGWLFMTSPVGSRRLSAYPFGWQYLPDEAMRALLQQATPADPRDAAALAADQAARP